MRWKLRETNGSNEATYEGEHGRGGVNQVKWSDLGRVGMAWVGWKELGGVGWMK
jgi:hypothetical protein